MSVAGLYFIDSGQGAGAAHLRKVRRDYPFIFNVRLIDNNGLAVFALHGIALSVAKAARERTVRKIAGCDPIEEATPARTPRDFIARSEGHVVTRVSTVPEMSNPPYSLATRGLYASHTRKHSSYQARQPGSRCSIAIQFFRASLLSWTQKIPPFNNPSV